MRRDPVECTSNLSSMSPRVSDRRARTSASAIQFDVNFTHIGALRFDVDGLMVTHGLQDDLGPDVQAGDGPFEDPIGDTPSVALNLTGTSLQYPCAFSPSAMT